MKNEQKIRDFSLHVISILVWFEILWAAVFLGGLVFQWSALTDQLAVSFFGSGFCVLLVLISLAVLNVAANLNIISNAQVMKTCPELVPAARSRSFMRTILAASGMIVIVVASLWLAEWNLYRTKENEMYNKLERIADNQLLNEAVATIRNDGNYGDLVKFREALSETIEVGAKLSLVFPLKIKDVDIYYELNDSWHGLSPLQTQKISDVALAKFIPTLDERKKFEKLIQGQLVKFSVPAAKEMRVFRLVTTAHGKIILLVDTSRRSRGFKTSY